MIALCDPIDYYYDIDDNSTNFDEEDFEVVSKLLPNYCLKLSYRHKDINLLTNMNSVAIILIAIHIYLQVTY